MSKQDHSASGARSDGAAKSQLKPSEVLSRAADLIEPEGMWCQHRAHGPRGAMCLVAALSASTPGDMIWGRVAAPVAEAIGHSGMIPWNDRKGRTQAEVVAALRKAADLARSEGQ